MLKISEFSKVTNTSARMLRHYDKIGLLHPLLVDEESSYRYYSAEQIAIANKITSLKNIGISLNDIKRILLKQLDLDKYLESHNQILENELAEKRLQLALLALYKKEEDFYCYPVEIKKIPSICVLSIRKSVTSYFEEENLWNELFAQIDKQDKKELGTSFSVFHGSIASHLEIEVMVGIPARLREKYAFSKGFPVSLVASTVTSGSYHSLSSVHDNMRRWLSLNNYYLSGNIMNIYHTSPATEDKEEEYITEICYPIEHS